MKKIAFLLILLGLLYAPLFPAEAIAPQLSTSGVDAGGFVTITVRADPFSLVNVAFISRGFQNGVPTNIGSIGSTDANGFLSVPISTSKNLIPEGASVFVSVNNQQSPFVIWPGSNNSFQGFFFQFPNLSIPSIAQNQSQIFSSTFVVQNSFQTSNNFQLRVGQQITVPISHGSGRFYEGVVSEPGVITTSIFNRSVLVTGQTPGTSAVTINSTNEDTAFRFTVTVTP